MNDKMMTLADAREGYYTHSGKASDSARQLAFAGLAVVWLFKKDVNGSPELDSSFLPAVGLFVTALAVDLLQYVFATIAWGGFIRWKEHQEDIDSTAEFSAPRQLNWPGNSCFALKLLCVVIAYGELSTQVWSMLNG